MRHQALREGTLLIIKIDVSSSYAGKLGPAANLNQNPFFEMASSISFIEGSKAGTETE
jgi:hypothetical protein